MDAYKLYRAERWLYLHHIPLLPKVVKGVIYLIHNSSIPYEAEIGDHCKFLYGGIGCVIGKETKIGDHVVIGTNVLTGGRSNSHSKAEYRRYGVLQPKALRAGCAGGVAT